MLSSAGFGQIGALAKLRKGHDVASICGSDFSALHVAGDGIDRKAART
jgi:hypothetical protein